MIKKKHSYVLGALICGLTVFAVGMKSSYAKERYEKLQLFTKILNIVQEHYVDKVEIKKLVYGGIKGILQELDPHTNFLPPEIYKEFVSETSGRFGGLGIEITVQDEILTIISPIEDSPAWKAGLEAGDKIVSVEGKSTKGMSLAEAAQAMKGKIGESLKIGIIREGLKAPKSYTITRKSIKVKSVKSKLLEKGYGYIRLTSFIEKSAEEVRGAIKKFQGKEIGLKGLILDLRKNPGGLLDQAIKISDFFLDQGIIVSTKGRDKKEIKVVNANASATIADFPLVVLIDEFSASASEIVAGALKDNKRALVMGKRSFGKGSVQSVITMGDGSGLKLTVARYYTPNGTSIQAKGISPDVTIDEVDPEGFQKAIIKRRIRRESDIKGHLEVEEDSKKPEEKVAKKKKSKLLNWWKKGKDKKSKEINLLDDYQVSQALKYLKAYKVMKEM